MKLFYLILFVTAGFFNTSKLNFKNENMTDAEIERFNYQLNEIKEVISTDSKYNKKIAFLVDMRIKSGKNRFFVYDLVNNKILDQGLVAHGSGSETQVRGELKFSNEPNSNCTALGRYSVEKCYKGIFGKAYRLNGLDETNSNALKRAIVLHHYSAVPEEEQDYYISRSKGCPMVNEQFFKRIEKIIDNSKAKIVLDIYY
ncbi:murein L,D-transpeptidase catalytic domain family protein [Flavobacterium sp. MMLR14_040]|uniref:murein L,D-transpeptidase catalytic domain-containing protein n=1 Tax=Flavobacterium sp. MMLR14_040 TaxID=3093843 RepID=UPI00298F5E81|nr:murein L,D-transpeptidase catalytic domain family protein [Flavobacterium sp. MMLR14_040]MDW8853080.1 murein L,D-transpeptidase catalytic domain family protein [Flavobacterium sp. MMLR14_040]